MENRENTIEVNQPETIKGPEGEPMKVSRALKVGIEKFRSPSPAHYRLIWIFGREAWLANEDTTQYRRKYGQSEGQPSAEQAGQALAEKYGVQFIAL